MEHIADIQNITKGHENYLRWLMLLLLACPKALTCIIRKKLKERGNTPDSMLSGYMHRLHNLPDNQMCKCIPIDKNNTDIDSWDTSMLCSFILVSFGDDSDVKTDSVECILEQRLAIEKYISCASVDFNQYKSYRDCLLDELLVLCDSIDISSKFNCIRSIHTFTSEPIIVNKHIIEQLTYSNDLKSHAQLVIRENITKIFGNIKCISLLGEGTYTGSTMFVEELKDKNTYVNDDIVFSCSVNSDSHVAWRKNHNPLTNNDNVRIISGQRTHFLMIEGVQLKDAGTYMCTCKDTRTEAVLTVSEKRIEVVKHLPVAGLEVLEHSDVTLSCTVSVLTKTPIWLLNGTKLIYDTRVTALSSGHTHSLTILNVQIKDEGSYTAAFGNVISETRVTVGGNNNISHRRQLAEQLFRNWVRGALGLKYLKNGLEEVTEALVNQHFNGFMSRLSSIGQTCSQCNADTLLPFHEKRHCPNRYKCLCSSQPQLRKKCPNGEFCSQFYDYVVKDHRYHNPTLANTDVEDWTKYSWSVATAYINTPGYKGKKSSKEIDCIGLISLFLNNNFFSCNLGNIGKLNEFKKARDVRHEILHNPRYQLSDKELENNIQVFKDVLQVKNSTGNMPLHGFPGVKEALQNLNELELYEIDISISDDLTQKIQTLKEHAMNEEAEELKRAQAQITEKLQQTEEKLTKTAEELQLLRQIKPALKQNKWQSKRGKVSFDVDVYIHTVGNSPEATNAGVSVVNRILSYEISKIVGGKMQRDDTFNSNGHHLETTESLKSLLQMLCIKNTEFSPVSYTEVSLSTIRIVCRSYKKFAQLIEVLNSTEFEDQLFKVRKSLEKDTTDGYTYTVEANLSATTLKQTEKKIAKDRNVRSKKDASYCNVHPDKETRFYCSDHRTFLCQTCMEISHSSCKGMKDATHVKQKDNSITALSTKNVVNVKGSKEERTCGIIGSAVDANGSIFLVDKQNMSIKKFEKSQNLGFVLVQNFLIKVDPLDICCIRENSIVISLGDIGIVLINTDQCYRWSMGHFCMGLAAHARNLFITDRNKVYRYILDDYHDDLTEMKMIFSNQNNTNTVFEHLAVNSTGCLIYIAAGEDGIITIDQHGNYLSTSLEKMNVDIHDICVTECDTLYVCDTKSQSILKVVGETLFERVLTTTEPWTICYSNEEKKLIVAHFADNTILLHGI